MPRRLAIIGAGPIGCELAQAFARFGASVALVQGSHPLLGREDRDAAGLVERSLRRDGVEILGATVVARHAGEMLSELTLAIVGRVGLRTLARTIHPYPTQAEAIRKVADAYNRTRMTPLVHRVFERWLAWSR